MKISINKNTLTINGNIKSIQDFQSIKTSLDALVDKEKNIIINLVDSMSMTSSVIGYFNKLILKDKINIIIKIENSKLIELLKDLNLDKLFKVRKA
ncbi:MAG: hypothetical protein QM497_07615 [Sulfurimonas sp.]